MFKRRRQHHAAMHVPTPIIISQRINVLLIISAALLLLLVIYNVPILLTLSLGGAALAIVLSFPVRLLSHAMPRSLAILISFVIVLAAAILALIGIVPVLTEQLAALVEAIPGIAERIEARLPTLLQPLAEQGLLPISVDQFLANLKSDLLSAVADFGHRVLGGVTPFVAGTIGALVTVFGIIFITVYLLADARQLHRGILRAAPGRYRRDVRDLWNAFSFTLSRYLGGLMISLAVQGALSALALYFLGVPYAVLLGAWVSLTALIPYLGAWIGGVPAVLLALSISPTTAVLTVILFVIIQQLEGNLLTPRIQGQAVRVHPILILLAVIAGGELAGLLGIVFAVPVVAVLRVLYDFFKARLRVAGKAGAQLDGPFGSQ